MGHADPCEITLLNLRKAMPTCFGFYLSRLQAIVGRKSLSKMAISWRED